MIGAVAIYVVFGSGWLQGYIPILISLFTAALFALAPVLACFAQTISIERQLSKLDSIVNLITKQTQYFQSAKANLSAVRPASVTQNDFAVPMLLFATIIMFCSLLSFLSIYWEDDFKLKSSLLGGLYALQDGLTDGQVEAYQSGTLVVAAVAFFGAYLALFSRMLNQIDTNDLFPISFHYYSLWLITAMVLAAVMRHFASIFGITENPALLVIALAIGAVPAPFFTAFIHWAFNKLNIVGDKSDPKGEDMPSNLNLLMIDGLANDKIDRLSELGISDAQILACQNPFNVWVRTPYDLGLIVDWISQAQLYVCLREEGLRKARAQMIDDIHKFVEVLSDRNGCADLCTDLGLRPSYVAPLLASLNRNPNFVRLQEVKRSMISAELPAPLERSIDVALPGVAKRISSGIMPTKYNASVIPDGRMDIADKIVSKFAEAGYIEVQQLCALACAIVESNLDPLAVSSDRGRHGLFQLSQTDGPGKGHSPEALNDVQTNIDIVVAALERTAEWGAAETMPDAIRVFASRIVMAQELDDWRLKCLEVAKRLRGGPW
jgi:hypothetical protein